MRRVNSSTIAMLKTLEGLELQSYQDIGGVWTIGYGHTRTAGPNQTITIEEAETLLREDLANFEQGVNSLVKVPLTDNQFGALVSFAYNIGLGAFRSSTLLRRLNQGDYASVPSQMRLWNLVKGKVSRGLVNRRVREAALWGA